MSRPSLNEVNHSKGEVVLSTRYWDGIDRPEHVTLEGMNPDEARLWASRLIAAAIEAENYMLDANKVKLADKRLRLKALQSEIETIEQELAE